MSFFNPSDKENPITKTKYPFWPFGKRNTVNVKVLEADIVSCEGMTIVDNRNLTTDAFVEQVVTIECDNNQKKTFIVNARKVFWGRTITAFILMGAMTFAGWQIYLSINNTDLSSDGKTNPGYTIQTPSPTSPTPTPEITTPTPGIITPTPGIITPTPGIEDPKNTDPTASPAPVETTEPALPVITPGITEPGTTVPGNEVPIETIKPTDPIPAFTASLTYAPTGWTNNKVTGTIKASNQMKPLAGWVLSEDGKTLTQDFTANVPSAQITVTDIHGQTCTLTLGFDNIDKQAPNITIAGSANGWAKEDTLLSAHMTDEQSGIVAWAVTETNSAPSAWTIVNNTKVLDVTYTASKSGTYYFWSKDATGNISSKAIEVKIDKTAPDMTNIVSSITAWTKEDPTITSTITDNESGVVAWAVTTTKDTPTQWNNIANTKSFNVSHVVKQNGTFYVWGKNAAGLVSCKSISIQNIDKIAPVVGKPTFVVASDKKTAAIKANLSDSDSGIVAYTITTSTQAPSMWINLQKSKSIDLNVPVNDNDTYYLWTVDAAGNISAYQLIKVTGIDHSYNPETGTGNGNGNGNGNGTETGTGNGKNEETHNEEGTTGGELDEEEDEKDTGTHDEGGVTGGELDEEDDEKDTGTHDEGGTTGGELDDDDLTESNSQQTHDEGGVTGGSLDAEASSFNYEGNSIVYSERYETIAEDNYPKLVLKPNRESKKYW